MNQMNNVSSIRTEDSLVDIRSVRVEKDLPKQERLRSFVRQIGNPYRFRCGDFTLTASFANNGVSMEECLQGIIR